MDVYADPSTACHVSHTGGKRGSRVASGEWGALVGPFLNQHNGAQATGQGGGSNQKHRNRKRGGEGAGTTERRAGRDGKKFLSPPSLELTLRNRERAQRGPVCLIR